MSFGKEHEIVLTPGFKMLDFSIKIIRKSFRISKSI